MDDTALLGDYNLRTNNDDLTATEVRQFDQESQESSYIRGTMKPFVITDGKMITPRVGRPIDFDVPSNNDVTDSDFIDNSVSGDQLPIEFRSSENPHDTPNFQKLESDKPQNRI